MLPPLHHQRYQEFQYSLEQLSQTATTSELEVTALREQFQDVQQHFRNHIVSLSAEDCEPDYASRWQSVQTEIHKQMRLLEADLMLLQASRSSATFQSRTANVTARIKTLIQYCEALLQL